MTFVSSVRIFRRRIWGMRSRKIIATARVPRMWLREVLESLPARRILFLFCDLNDGMGFQRRGSGVADLRSAAV
eukprot:1158038-Pyramimonas_sp.AAC.1